MHKWCSVVKLVSITLVVYYVTCTAFNIILHFSSNLQKATNIARTINSTRKASSQTVNDSNLTEQSVYKFLQMLDKDPAFPFTFKSLRNETYNHMALTLGRKSKLSSRKLTAFQNSLISTKDPDYMKFHKGIRQNALYDPTDKAIEGVLRDMSTQKIVDVAQMKRGSTLKLYVTFENRGKAILKPMRILGFYMVPPAVGRMVNITSEILPYVTQNFSRTVFVNTDGQVCFHGTCLYFCDKSHAVCGNPELIETSLKAHVPSEFIAVKAKYPYAMHSLYIVKQWRTDKHYCENNVTQNKPFHTTRAVLDLCDITIFLFLIGDLDTSSLEYFSDFNPESNRLILDSGKGFCTPVDDVSILTPIRQCCKVRHSTFLKLAKLYIGPDKLGELADESMKQDPVYPILTDDHLQALDRRVGLTLQAIAECAEQSESVTDVIIDDNL